MPLLRGRKANRVHKARANRAIRAVVRAQRYQNTNPRYPGLGRQPSRAYRVMRHKRGALLNKVGPRRATKAYVTAAGRRTYIRRLTRVRVG